MIISILLILLGIVVAAIGTPHSAWWFIIGGVVAAFGVWSGCALLMKEEQ